VSLVKPRTTICLGCRTALFAGESCDLSPDHEVADIGTEAGRERLLAATWGDGPERERAAAAAVRAQRFSGACGVGGFGAGSFLAWLALSAGAPEMVASGIAGGLITYSGSWLSLRRGAIPAPRGPAADAVDGAPVRGPRGVVAGDSEAVSPACGVDCVAYAIELQLDGPWGTRVMFRDAVTLGFDVVLESGGLARVPAGRFRLPGPMRQLVDFDNRAIEDHLREFDEAHDPGLLFDPLRYNVVAESVLVPGDRVQLASTFEPEVNPRAVATSYRDQARALLTPRGVPVIRLLTPTA
jgi:hypothetical protein